MYTLDDVDMTFVIEFSIWVCKSSYLFQCEGIQKREEILQVNFCEVGRYLSKNKKLLKDIKYEYFLQTQNENPSIETIVSFIIQLLKFSMHYVQQNHP